MPYTQKLAEALSIAIELHSGQTRKGSDIPYVTHIFSVAALVGENGGNETEVIAAVLHDAVEDAGGQATLTRIREHFGTEVADIVDACSDTDSVPKPPWRPRKQAYIDVMQSASRSVLLVSCADKLHNARATLHDLQDDGPSVWERFSGKRDGTLWYYTTLREIFDRRLDTPLVRRFSEVVHDLERFGE